MNWYPLVFLAMIILLSIFVLWFYTKEGFQNSSSNIVSYDTSNNVDISSIPIDSSSIPPSNTDNSDNVTSSIPPSNTDNSDNVTSSILTTEQIALVQEAYKNPLTDVQAEFIKKAQSIPVDKRDVSDTEKQCDVFTKQFQGLSTSILNYRNKGMWSNVKISHSMMRTIETQLTSLGC